MQYIKYKKLGLLNKEESMDTMSIKVDCEKSGKSLMEIGEITFFLDKMTLCNNMHANPLIVKVIDGEPEDIEILKEKGWVVEKA